MKKVWLASKQAIPTKQLLFALLFIESLAITLAIGSTFIFDKSLDTHFKEKGFITTLSCIQLAIAGVLALIIYTTVKSSANLKLAKSTSLWLIIGLGLLFLGLDDRLEIHEQIDLLLHDLLAIEETNITDLADDLIVALYLLIFLGCLWWQRRIIPLFKSSYKWFLIGFGITIVMIVLDVMSNNDLFTSRFIDPARDVWFREWMSVVEDSAKILAEGMFIVGIYQCQKIVKSLMLRTN